MDIVTLWLTKNNNIYAQMFKWRRTGKENKKHMEEKVIESQWNSVLGLNSETKKIEKMKLRKDNISVAVLPSKRFEDFLGILPHRVVSFVQEKKYFQDNNNYSKKEIFLGQ